MSKKNNKQRAEVVIKEATPEEEQAKLNQSIDEIKLGKYENEKPFNEVVEEERSQIFATYKKTRTINNIITAIVVVVFIASMVLFVQFKGWGQIVGGVAIGVALVFMIVYYILTRNKFPDTTKKYIRAFMITTDTYVFDMENLFDQKLFFEKRYSNEQALGDRVYKDVIDTASRNIVEGTYKEKPFQCGEYALYKAGAKRGQKTVLFVGKYLTLENSLHFEDRYVIRILGEKDTDAPNDIEDLVALSEQNRFVIYGKEGANLEKDLGKDLIENLKSIECVGALLNVNIVFWAGRTVAYLSYDDSVVAIPFDHAINTASYQQLKKNIGDLLEILVD